MLNSPEKLPLPDRLDQRQLKLNEFQKINGGCVISADIEATLQKLKEACKPTTENLPARVRSSVEKTDKQGRPLDVIWSEKIAEGATHVGVIDGAFHFFKGDQILSENNKDFRMSALPPVWQMREEEKAKVREGVKAQIAELRSHFRQSEFTNFVGGPVVAPVQEPVVPVVESTQVAVVEPVKEPEPYVPLGEVHTSGGTDLT